jgi:hypothetical protein
MKPDDRPTHAIYLALTGTPRNRKAMRGVGVWITRLRALLSRPGGVPPIVAIHAPGADAQGVRWPDGVEVISSAGLLDAADVARAGDLARSEAVEVIDTTHGWPTCGGVHMGLVNRSLIQENLFELHLMTESFRRLLTTRPVSGCTIITGTAGDGAALRDVARQADVPARLVTLPRWVATLSLPSLMRRGSVEQGSGPPPASEAGPARLLLVSESQPMAGMYDEVERALDADGVSDFMRVQYLLDPSRSARPDEPRRIHWPRPDYAPRQGGALPPAPRRVRDGSGTGGIREAVDEIVAGIVRHSLPAQVEHVARVRAFLERVEPDLVVVGNDRFWIGLSWVLCARSLGIPSLMVQDGVATRHPKWRSWCADRVAVNGRHLGDILEAEGCPRDRLVVVGQPRYDSRHFARPTAAPGPGRDPATPPSVLFATQPDQDPGYVESVLEVICASEVEAVLRPHPSTRPAVLSRLRELGERLGARWAAEAPIDALIRESDVVVVRDSTVALEAALEATPVITVNLTGALAAVPYADLGVSREVTDTAELRTALIDAVAGRLPSFDSSEEVRAGVEYLVGPCDGGSAERVVSVIREMLGSSSGGDGAGSGH